LDAAEWDTDEQLIILDHARDHFVDGFIRDKLVYAATAIRVNNGY